MIKIEVEFPVKKFKNRPTGSFVCKTEPKQ
jgi:hypothetical protein